MLQGLGPLAAGEGGGGKRNSFSPPFPGRVSNNSNFAAAIHQHSACKGDGVVAGFVLFSTRDGVRIDEATSRLSLCEADGNHQQGDGSVYMADRMCEGGMSGTLTLVSR